MAAFPSVFPRSKAAQTQYREMPALRIDGARVCLRPPCRQDWPQWAEVRGRNRERLEPFEPRWSKDSLARPAFERRLKRQTKDWFDGRAYSFLIFRKADACLAGGVNVNSVTRGAAQFASLGYWIDGAIEGRGYMRESLSLVLGFCFGELRLHRLNAACLPHNRRSMHLLERLGFTREGFAKGYIQINGVYEDHILYGLTAEDYGCCVTAGVPLSAT